MIVDIVPDGAHNRTGCCSRDDLMWLVDDLLIAARQGRRLPTDVIDQLPPWRAQLVVGVCLAAEADLQDGTPELFAHAVAEAARRDAGATGWWRQALGLPARVAAPPARPFQPPDGFPMVDRF